MAYDPMQEDEHPFMAMSVCTRGFRDLRNPPLFIPAPFALLTLLPFLIYTNFLNSKYTFVMYYTFIHTAMNVTTE